MIGSRNWNREIPLKQRFLVLLRTCTGARCIRMPNWGYSVKEFDPDRAVRCSGRELNISPKAATEICRKIRGMRLDQAKGLLEAVEKKKRAIAYRRYKKEVPHHSLDEGWYAGRYPVKAAKLFLFLLEELESNCGIQGS